VLWLKGEKGDFYQVAYPDGREAYIPKSSAKTYESWLASLNPTEEALISTAKKLMGIPYLWGGTSLKGLDCSGFTKNVYFLNGLVLPRDASQQVHTGNLIDTSQGFEDLRPGDLLFFGRKASESTTEKVTHVGMWIGNNEYIHASGSSGKVTINSFNKDASNFNKAVFDSFLRAKRILNSTQGDILKLQSAKVY
jgi:cell wall-associated NlpC family hydrolase